MSNDVRTPLWLSLRRRNATADTVLRLAGVIAPPVDIQRIVEMLEVPIRLVADPGWYGAVAFDTHMAVIWIREGDPPLRQRFTIAHEIGHLLLHPAGVTYRDDTFAGTPFEQEANDFAANLLMPAWMLGPLALELRGDADLLAGLFEVAREAMQYRLRSVGLATAWGA